VKVVWSRRAVTRAEEEARFIAQDKPGAALAWLEGLFAHVDQLEHFPRLGPVVPELGKPQYRELSYESHRVIYRISQKQITVLTVRRWKRLLDTAEVP
jgi:toxin ParE1/3/4